ncbi:MAG: hypothetical protein IPI30_17090 [Saprospiraceae bacterium]|nr:hypothetical protein [Candidatus Vicinibacter affinis]
MNFLVWHKLETCASKEENVMAQVGNLRQQRGNVMAQELKVEKLAPAKKNGLSLSEN